MDNLVWMTKSKSAANRESAADITISRTKTKNGQKQSSITFRNNCFLKFAVGDYMVFAVTKTRTRQFTLYADSIRFKRVYRRLFAIIRWAFKGALHRYKRKRKRI